MATSPPSAMRCGDADREKVVSALRDNYAEGRLTLEEFDQRSDAAYQARTFGDLTPLLADLPHAPVQPSQQAKPARSARTVPSAPPPPPHPARARMTPMLGILAICIFVAAIGIRGFWPFWLLIPTFIILSGSMRHRRGRSYGPEGQLRDEARDLAFEQQRLRIQERRARIERRRQRLERRMR